MPRSKKPDQPQRKARKDTWQIYSLQSLHPSRFARVVSNIVKGKFFLVGNARRNNGDNSPEK